MAPRSWAVFRKIDILRHVFERVVLETLASVEIEAEDWSARQNERLVAQVLASPALEPALADALESELTLRFTERLVDSPQTALAS